MKQKFFYPKRKSFIIACLLIVFGLVLKPTPVTSEEVIENTKTVSGTITIFDKQGNEKKNRAGVIVFLDELGPEAYSNATNETVIIQQIKKEFKPEVLPVLAGTTVEFPNNDNIVHNVFSLSKAKPFDLGYYKGKISKSVRFDTPGLVKVYCNIHPDMIAHILVLPTPHFVMTDENGKFSIPNVPIGRGVVRAWHAKSRSHPEQVISITESGIRSEDAKPIEEIKLNINEDVVSFKHKNKFGQNYPSKY